MMNKPAKAKHWDSSQPIPEDIQIMHSTDYSVWHNKKRIGWAIKVMFYDEGMWVLVDDETKKVYDSDFEGGEFYGRLMNNSSHWEIDYGELVSFEMKGSESIPWALDLDIPEEG